MKKLKRNMKPFGVYLKIARNCEAWSIREVADKLGLSKTYYHNLEQGEVERPKLEVLLKISNLFNLPSDEVIIKAGRIPQDVYYKIVDNPDLIKLIRDLYDVQ